MTPEESAQTGIVLLLKLIAELVADVDWPGCAGKKVWDGERRKMVYRDCGACPFCKAEELAVKLAAIPIS